MKLSYISGILMLISGLPQIIKLVKTKNSADISLLSYFITIIAVSFMLYESIYSANMRLIFANGISIIIMTVIVILILVYKI